MLIHGPTPRASRLVQECDTARTGLARVMVGIRNLGYKISAQSGCCLSLDKNLGPAGGDHVLRQYEREKCSTQTEMGMGMEMPRFSDTKELGL